jgi:hypothetical protein
MFERQVRTLVAFVQRLEITNGSDEDASNFIREFVSSEILNDGDLEVTTRAIGELGESESRRLIDLVVHCSSNFYKNGTVMSAIAVPIALLWKSRQDRTYILNRGGHEYLSLFAKKVQEQTGAQSVILDSHLYTADELLKTPASALLVRLKSLCAGFYKPIGHPYSSSIKSQIDGVWAMRYFLGVEVQKDDVKQKLNNSSIQNELNKYLHFGESAVVVKDVAKPDLGADRIAVCHGILYLNKAMQLGEKAIRKYQLKSHIESVAVGAHQVEVKFFLNRVSNIIELLICADWLTLKYQWRIFSDENIDDFNRDLMWSAQTSFEKCDDFSIEEIDFKEFELTLNKTGLAWMKRVIY